MESMSELLRLLQNHSIADLKADLRILEDQHIRMHYPTTSTTLLSEYTGTSQGHIVWKLKRWGLHKRTRGQRPAKIKQRARVSNSKEVQALPEVQSLES